MVSSHQQVGVLLGAKATPLEQFAAEQLCDYLEKLFGLKVASATSAGRGHLLQFLVGDAASNPAAIEHGESFAGLSEQGILLKRVFFQKRPALIIGGGSPQAVLWSVYEVIERWGVCFLTDRDVLPTARRSFALPDYDETKEPIFRIRAHPTIQDFAASGESWGFEHFSVLIDQLAKLKFNRICLYAYGWQPFLHWAYKGVERRSATLWYDYRFHITGDMVGRELFGDETEFWNPDLPLTSNYHELVKAGIKLLRRLIDHAKSRGMECVVAAPMTDFPPEFASLLPGAERSHQLGGVSIVPGKMTRMDDQNLYGMAGAVLDATVNTYPNADRVTVWMPEFRQWTGEYEKAWNALDAKYRISEVLSLPDVLAAARARGEREGDAERVVTEVKADITSLYFYDKMLRGKKRRSRAAASEPEFLYWGPVEELFPILDRILPESWQLEIMPTNHPATLLKRVGVLNTLPTSISATMALTIDDDNIGVLPQLTTGALHRTVKVMKERNWSGFTARQRFPADHDVPMNYLARVAWSDEATPENVTADVIGKICGTAAVPLMDKLFKAVEKTTEILSVTNFAFPADWPIATSANPGGMLLKHMMVGEMPPVMEQARKGYQQALRLAQKARAASKSAGRWYVDFWIGRLEFAIAYMSCAQDVQRIANVQKQKDHVLFTSLADQAVDTLESGLRAYARVARNQTDIGAIATVNEFARRPLKARSWAYHAHGAHFLQPFL